MLLEKEKPTQPLSVLKRSVRPHRPPREAHRGAWAPHRRLAGWIPRDRSGGRGRVRPRLLGSPCELPHKELAHTLQRVAGSRWPGVAGSKWPPGSGVAVSRWVCRKGPLRTFLCSCGLVGAARGRRPAWPPARVAASCQVSGLRGQLSGGVHAASRRLPRLTWYVCVGRCRPCWSSGPIKPVRSKVHTGYLFVKPPAPRASPGLSPALALVS